MKYRLLLVAFSVMMVTLRSADGSELRQGTWKLVDVKGAKMASDYFKSHCELVTFKGDSAFKFVNGNNDFKGSSTEMISKYYDKCTMEIVNDTLRFSRMVACCDIPYEWDWIRYSESLINMNGSWRWVETDGGFTGVSRTQSDYYKILKINKDTVTIIVNNSNVSSDSRDNYFNTTFKGYSWLIINDTLIGYQVPQCCDIPYLYKFVNWVGGETNSQVRMQNYKPVNTELNSNSIFDCRGRAISATKQFGSGIFLKCDNVSRLKIVNTLKDN